MSAKKTYTGEKIAVQTPNVPGHTSTVDAAMYNAMRDAVLKVMPTSSPGMAGTEMWNAVLPHLPEDLYPNGDKVCWWSKTVQLDLEAKGVLVREQTKPLRWYRKA